jgi:hypothetical protein
MTPEESRWLREEITAMRRDLVEIKVTIARNTLSIEHHIKRTDLLEGQVNNFWTKALSVGGVLSGIAVAVSKLMGWA